MTRLICLFLPALILVASPAFSDSKAPIKNRSGQTNNDVMLTGNISVRSAQNGNIVLIVDSSLAGTPDAIPDLVVRFAPAKKKAKYQNLSFDFYGARIFLQERRVAVVGSDGLAWIKLSLEPVGKQDPSYGLFGSDSADPDFTVRITKGVALHRETIRRTEEGSLPGIDIEKIIFIKDQNNIKTQDNEFELEANCPAGGPGSTSCSYDCGGTGCSVSCSSGKYSCCKCIGPGSVVPSCTCISN